jgi:hypothetical protein
MARDSPDFSPALLATDRPRFRVGVSTQERGVRGRSEHDQENLERAGIEPAPERRRQYSWATFIKAQLSAISAADFFTVEVLSWVGLVRYHVFFVMDLAWRRRCESAARWSAAARAQADRTSRQISTFGFPPPAPSATRTRRFVVGVSTVDEPAAVGGAELTL